MPGSASSRAGYVVAVGAAVEGQVAGGERLAEPDERATARARHRQLVGVELGEHVDASGRGG